MAHAGEDHGNAMLVGGIDHFLVAHGTARLDHCGDTGSGGGIDAVAEREESIGGHHRTLHFQVFIGGLDTGNFRAVNTAHLACAHTDGAARPGVDDGVGFHVLGHFPGEQQVVQLLFGRLALGDDFYVFHGHHTEIPVLHQQAAGHALVVHGLGALAVEFAAGQKAYVLLGSNNLDRFWRHARGNNDFHKLAIHDGLGSRGVQFPVKGNDAAERRSGVGGEGQVVGLQDVGTDGYATGVGVLDDDTGRVGKRLNAFQGGIGVGYVVVAQFLALQLPGGGYAGFLRVVLGIEGRALVRIFAVTHVLNLHELGVEGAGEVGVVVVRGTAAQVVGDGTVVTGGVLEGFYRQVEASAVGQLAVVVRQLFQYPAVVGGVHHNGHIVVVLGGGANHGGAADVDVLNGGGQVAVRVGHGVLERVQVDHHHVDGVDAMLAHNGVIGTATAKDATVNLRVQGFDPPVHHFREAGVIGHFGDGHLVFLQQTEGSAGGKQLNAAFCEGAAELDDAGFITHADQSATDGGISLICHGSLSSLFR